MSNLSQFLGGGGGGLTPKFQEFTSSGTFTPTQELIDAGGYIEVFLVGGGAKSVSSNYGGNGGEVIIKRMYLNSTSGISVTIAAASSGNGNNSSFNGSSAGGVNVTALGGSRIHEQNDRSSATWGAIDQYSAGQGVFGYGAGGSKSSNGGVKQAKSNSGQGSNNINNGGSGYCLVKWYE